MTTHDAIKVAAEEARGNKWLGSMLQSSVVLKVENQEALEVLQKYADELDAIFVVSSVDINGDVGGDDAEGWKVVKEFEYGTVVALPPKQAKCPRCWRYVAPVEDALCGRCDALVGEGVD
jgi:isoleucyl-tRNA synthetase